MHGLGDTCCDPLSLGKIIDWIRKEYPGIYVLSLDVKGDFIEQTADGWLLQFNKQVDDIISIIQADPKLKDGFNMIGFSQGGILIRGYVERCNDPPVRQLISVGGPNMGVASLPQCLNGTICDIVNRVTELGVYNPIAQELIAPSNYFKDLGKYDDYLEHCIFLPDINNERAQKNALYKQRMESLLSYVLVMFTEDTIVIPKESEWFGFYDSAKNDTIVPMESQEIFLDDWIGLKTLYDSHKMHFLSCPTNHLQFSKEWFYQNLMPLFNDTNDVAGYF